MNRIILDLLPWPMSSNQLLQRVWILLGLHKLHIDLCFIKACMSRRKQILLKSLLWISFHLICRFRWCQHCVLQSLQWPKHRFWICKDPQLLSIWIRVWLSKLRIEISCQLWWLCRQQQLLREQGWQLITCS